jgi:hypothetical protein
MATRYIRNFSFKDSLTDAEVLEELKFFLEQVAPAIAKVPGVRAVNLFSGAGALRADLTISLDMDNAGVYESALVSAELRGMLGRMYGAWDMKSSSQTFRREVTPQLIQALSGAG